MSLPTFNLVEGVSSQQFRRQVSDRIRFERVQIGLSQTRFAEQCGIPLRTYKRFELGYCDSFDVFIKIVMAFGRVRAFELFFVGNAQDLTLRTPLATLDRLMEKVRPKA